MPKCLSNEELNLLEKDLKEGQDVPILFMLAAVLELKRCRKLLKKLKNKS